MAFLDCHWCKLSGIFGFCLLLLVALGPFQESSQVGIVDPVWGAATLVRNNHYCIGAFCAMARSAIMRTPFSHGQ